MKLTLTNKDELIRMFADHNINKVTSLTIQNDYRNVMDYYHLSVAVKNIQKSINLGYCYMYVIITEAFLNYDIAYGSLDRSSC